MTQEELYNIVNHENSSNNKERTLNAAFPALMRKVYVWMTLALLLTAITAFGVATSPTLLTTIYSSRVVMWGLIFAEFALVIAISGAINKLSLSTATLLFILYSVLNGATLSAIFVIYTDLAIVKAFIVSAGTFGAMAVFGYTTKRDLSTIGRIMFMLLIGIIIASIVNIFLKSGAFDYIISFIGVAVFTGLTAWDSQTIKKMLMNQYDMSENSQKIALLGALNLYLDFINLFLYLLRIFGRK
jgi:FtsH-binding integral membrane protein